MWLDTQIYLNQIKYLIVKKHNQKESESNNSSQTSYFIFQWYKHEVCPLYLKLENSKRNNPKKTVNLLCLIQEHANSQTIT